jgi:hypothetical protein
MPDIALYYPYTKVRDETWLKAAALHWPKLAVITSSNYMPYPTRAAQVLGDELDFFVEVDPAFQAERVAEQFLEFIRRHSAELERRYNRHPGLALGPLRDHRSLSPWVARDGIDWVHVGRISGELTGALLTQKLGFPSADGLWFGMHPRLAEVYNTALAERLAEANHMPAITDQVDLYGRTLNGWDVDTLARVLLADEVGFRLPRRDATEVAALYAAVAIRTVVPHGLGDVPVERVVQARRVLAAEFDEFRAHLDALTEQFAEIAQIESTQVLHARLQVMAERDLRRPIGDLERGLRGLGLEPARAVLGAKSLELPAAVAAVATGVGIPAAVGEAGLVAARLIASGVRVRRGAHEQRRGVPGYLLGLREGLDPQGVLDRVRWTLRRDGSRSGRRWLRRFRQR